MPNTLIREGYLDSDRVSALCDFDDRVFFRLLLAADDAGRTDGRADKLRSVLFPTREVVRSADVTKTIERLIAAGLITRWEWDGKPVIQIMRWQRRSGAQFSKFPDRTGSFRIEWVEVETRDGKQSFSATSLAMGCNGVMEPIGNPYVGVSEKSTETKTDTKTETQAAERRGWARSRARCWITSERPDHLKARFLTPLEDLIYLIGYEAAIEAVKGASSAGKMENPYAWALKKASANGTGERPAPPPKKRQFQDN